MKYYLIGLDIMDNWDKELEEMRRDEMNRYKTGEPFHHPATFFLMLGYVMVYAHPSYSQKHKGSSKDIWVIKFHSFLVSVI